MIASKKSEYDRIILMKRESNAPKTYEDVIQSVGVPNKTVIDNVQFLTG